MSNYNDYSHDEKYLKLNPIKFENSKAFEIDFSKVKSIEDIIEILKGLDMVVYADYCRFDILKPYLIEKGE